jgi:hypothetical protein
MCQTADRTRNKVVASRDKRVNGRSTSYNKQSSMSSSILNCEAHRLAGAMADALADKPVLLDRCQRIPSPLTKIFVVVETARYRPR